jgi:hypothetical protein
MEKFLGQRTKSSPRARASRTTGWRCQAGRKATTTLTCLARPMATVAWAGPRQAMRWGVHHSWSPSTKCLRWCDCRRCLRQRGVARPVVQAPVGVGAPAWVWTSPHRREGQGDAGRHGGRYSHRWRCGRVRWGEGLGASLNIGWAP